MGYSTGNAISDDIGKMNFTGNVIPAIWFQTITNSSGRPNLLACQLLSEFVYWYRPAEVRDEKTGQFIGYRTKFKGDLLQKSYKSLAELYHVSKQQVVRAVVFLEKEIQVVKRVFRSVPGRDGTIYNNVLYIWIDSERLKELTYPMEDEPGLPPGIDYDEDPVLSDESAAAVDNVDKDTPLPSNLMIPSHQKRGDPPIKFDGTYTENTTEINNSCNPSVCHNGSGKGRDGPGRTESWPVDRENEDYEDLVRRQVSYEAIRQDFESMEDTGAVDILDTCVSVAASVYKHTGKYLQIAGERMPIGIAMKLIRKLDMFHVKHIVRSYLEVEQEIRNVYAYMLVCIFNTIRTLPAHEANLFVSKGRGVVHEKSG